MKQFCLLLIAAMGVLSSFAQNKEDTTDGRFHDDLLNHLVGKWTVSGVAHGETFQNLTLEAKWIMNHQYLQINEKGIDTIPWLKMPWEAMFLIGYNHSDKRYIFYELTIRGVDGPSEGFSYATRTGDKLKISSKMSSDESINQYFIWERSSNSWHLLSKLEKGGKEGDSFLDLKVLSIK
jgi:hypothetical protein